MGLTSLTFIRPTRSLPLVHPHADLFCSIVVWIWIWFLAVFQAEILAKYKPSINTTLLIPNLNQVNATTTKALEYFKSTRHIIVYYEDVVKNRTVSILFYIRLKHYYGPSHIHFFLIWTLRFFFSIWSLAICFAVNVSLYLYFEILYKFF